MRSDEFLQQKLEIMWKNYFSDVPKSNRIRIHFGRKALRRLGSIRQRKHRVFNDTLILINGHFRDPEIPEFVIDATIAHELCHYTHGFASPLPQLSRYPHRGGHVDRELKDRGLTALIDREEDWLDLNWKKYITRK